MCLSWFHLSGGRRGRHAHLFCSFFFRTASFTISMNCDSGIPVASVNTSIYRQYSACQCSKPSLLPDRNASSIFSYAPTVFFDGGVKCFFPFHDSSFPGDHAGRPVPIMPIFQKLLVYNVSELRSMSSQSGFLRHSPRLHAGSDR